MKGDGQLTVDSGQLTVSSPTRMCVACRERGGKESFVRVVKFDSVEVDFSGKKAGRGAYIHRSPDCLGIALKKRSLDRALKCRVPEEIYAELEELVSGEV
ncbi:MAG: YlxR family protein [Oscillospiraceae bacterium]|nr:YlxR family protein [Oscillospiraceae bacterium]